MLLFGVCCLYSSVFFDRGECFELFLFGLSFVCVCLMVYFVNLVFVSVFFRCVGGKG